jgi:hypothetical protein
MRTPAALVISTAAVAEQAVLSVVLSVGGGIVRHSRSLDVGRWRGRLVRKR